nr:transposase domain-containing protein [Klebsiella pneumoniae]
MELQDWRKEPRKNYEAYLRHILSVLPEWPSNRVDELLPWNVVLTNK